MPRELGTRRSVPYKVIDTWVYKVKDVEFEQEEYVSEEDREEGSETEKYRTVKHRIKNKIVTCELRLEKTTKQSEESPHPLDTVKLELHCKELNVHLEGTDVESLRSAMWSMLDKKFEIKWERYFLVQVNRERLYGGGDGSGMTFSYKDIHKGTTWDGKVLMKIYRGGSYGNSDKIEPWPGEFKDKGGNVIACIPDNEMNQAALKEFSRRIDVLREKLADFLRPDRIMETLTNMAGLALLPPAPPGDPKEE